MRYVDRSRILEYLRCPRSRYLGSHFNGIGISTSQLRIPLGTGTHVHGGLEALLKGSDVDTAVSLSVDAYRAEADAALSAMSTHLDHYDYTVDEQSALVEALVRAYHLRGLPALLAAYEVVEVESEYEYDLTPNIRMMSRLDGLLRNRATGDLDVLSFKTDTGAKLEDKLPDAQIDLQGLTEPLAMLATRGAHAAGVKMEWLLKGSWKEETRGSGLHYQDSYIVRPWIRDNGFKPEFAWQYYWPCPGTEHKVAGKRTWTCKGEVGRTHGLGDSWTRTPIWKHMPIKEWIDILAADPGDPLSRVLYLPPPIRRLDADVIGARRIITALELEVDEKLRRLEEHGDYLNGGAMPDALDILFPRSGAWTNTCNHSFGGVCQFYTLCHGTAELAQWESQGFRQRTPHHKPEADALVQIGGK